MKIAVIGTGYVGLVTGVCFAETGNDVVCVDIDIAKIEQLNKGIPTIFEDGLERLLSRNVEEGRLKFTVNNIEAVKNSEVIFLALPTPPNEDGSADLKYILAETERIAPFLKEDAILIIKSTVPVGTCDKVLDIVNAKRVNNVYIVSNPEFLKEGAAIEDCLKPERIIIGTESDFVKNKMLELYASYMKQGNKIAFMKVRSAELTKYASNAFLATKISFMNEISIMCDELNCDVEEVRVGMGTDSRIGRQFLYAGIGFGGSCFPKDVAALQQTAKENNFDFKIINAVLEVNERQNIYFFNKILKHFKNNISGKTFALWGLAYKPGTDDIRDSPAIKLAMQLLKHGAVIKAYDPEAMKNVAKLNVTNLFLMPKAIDALENANALIIATEWNVFRNPNLALIANTLNEKIVFDGRNILDSKKMKQLGYEYYDVGRN